MQKVFLSHSSTDKESYVTIVARKLLKNLGQDSVIIDEFSFQEGRKTIEEIEENLSATDLFVFFISKKALESDWVKHELFRAEKLWSSKKLQQICPIIIEEGIEYNNSNIPDWLKKIIISNT